MEHGTLIFSTSVVLWQQTISWLKIQRMVFRIPTTPGNILDFLSYMNEIL